MASKTLKKQGKSPAVTAPNKPAEIPSPDSAVSDDADDHRLVSGIHPTVRSGTIEVDEIEEIQVLNEHGEIVDDAHDPKLSDEELLRVHRAMVSTRKLDAMMLAMQRQGQMGTFAPNLGQEATMIGQVYPMTPEDWFAPSYRAFGAQVWRGWPPLRLLLLWAGFFEGFPPPKGVNDLPFSIVIGSHVPTATGVAMGMKMRKDPHCVVTNFGDGASSQGVVAESFNFASVYKAPIVFVLENNGWAISTPVTSQAGVGVFALHGIGYGIPSVRVDGNDILGMIAATTRACEHARAGNGPYLIEAVTYRMSLHTTADDPKAYRRDSEVEQWEVRCPIRRMELLLKSRKLLDDGAIEQIHTECNDEVMEARAKFFETAKADPKDIFDFVYESLPPELEEQKAEYLAKLKRMGID